MKDIPVLDESNISIRNELPDEMLNDLLSTYDYRLEVPQTEYITCNLGIY
jgi:hypothetical protein